MTATRIRGIKSKISQNHNDPEKPRHGKYLFVQCVPETTHAAFKAECERQRESMRDAIIKMMRFYVYNFGIDLDKIEHKMRYVHSGKIKQREKCRKYYWKVKKPQHQAEKLRRKAADSQPTQEELAWGKDK